MNLNQVTVPSENVNKAIAFYKKLGLRLIVHTHDAYARFECPDGESTFSIHQVEKVGNTEAAILYFEVANVALKVLEIKKQGITFDTETTEQSWLWTEARLKDPDGNQLIIYQAGDNRKNPPWRIKE